MEKKSATFVLVILFCFFAGAFFFLRSPYFHIKQFYVEGLERVSRDEILSRCGQDALSIFAFKTDKAKDLIEASPWIETASVRRKLPDTIVITVTERLPVAFTPAGDELWLVDIDGRVLGRDDGTWRGLAAITGPEGTLAPGQFLDPETYGWGLRVLAALGPAARERLTEISVHGGEVSLILDDGCRVLVGKEAGDIYVKSVTLDSVLDDLAANGQIAERIDLRFDKVAIKLKYESESVER
ncbi:MAG: cell division protein FtsQ/DivIB [Bacillota bacterium]